MAAKDVKEGKVTGGEAVAKVSQTVVKKKEVASGNAMVRNEEMADGDAAREGANRCLSRT